MSLDSCFKTLLLCYSLYSVNWQLALEFCMTMHATLYNGNKAYWHNLFIANPKPYLGS